MEPHVLKGASDVGLGMRGAEKAGLVRGPGFLSPFPPVAASDDASLGISVLAAGELTGGNPSDAPGSPIRPMAGGRSVRTDMSRMPPKQSADSGNPSYRHGHWLCEESEVGGTCGWGVVPRVDDRVPKGIATGNSDLESGIICGGRSPGKSCLPSMIGMTTQRSPK